MGGRELLSALSDAGMSVTVEGDRLVIRPGSKLTDYLRAALRAAKPELLTLLRGQHASLQPQKAAAEHTSTVSPLQIYRQGLMRLHWPQPQAEAFAALLWERDRSGDDRVSCFECAHYRPRACENYHRAGLSGPEIGSDWAGLFQRCNGFLTRFPAQS